MDRYTKNVIKYLKSRPGYSFIWALGHDSVPDGFGDKGRFIKALRHLADNGYAKYVVRKNLGECGVYLTYEGLYRTELERAEFVHKFLTSFVTGFFSGVASTAAGGILLAYILSRLGI